MANDDSKIKKRKTMKVPKNGNTLMTLEEVAAYCDVPEMVVHRWIMKNQLAVCFLESGEKRFRLIDVKYAFERHSNRPSTDTTRNIPRLKKKQ